MTIKKKLMTGIFSTILLFTTYSEISVANGSGYATPGCNSGSLQNLNKIRQWGARQGLTCRGLRQGFGYLPQGSTSYFIGTKLYAGNSYRIIAAGNEHVRNLKLEVYDSAWSLVGKNSSSRPVVHVKNSGYYRIRARMLVGKGCSNVMICKTNHNPYNHHHNTYNHNHHNTYNHSHN